MDTPDPIPLLCPNCKYDVSQTLRDQIYTCPECGGGLNPGRCIRVYPTEPIHIKLICRAVVFIASFATTFATIALLAGAGTITPLLVVSASLAVLIIPSRLRVRLPPEAPFPRVPFEYFVHYSGIVLFIAACVVFMFFILIVAVRT